MILDLMSLSTWLMLMIWSFDDDINILMLSLPMGTMICLHERPLVVMFSLGLGVFEL